jgi:hypothetical protein
MVKAFVFFLLKTGCIGVPVAAVISTRSRTHLVVSNNKFGMLQAVSVALFRQLVLAAGVSEACYHGSMLLGW